MIKNAIENLINKWACCHKWEEERMTRGFEIGNKSEKPNCLIYILVCKKCGKLKKIRIG